MGRIVVNAFVTLDGVMQAPGGPDEDPSGGFSHGGWQRGFDDEDLIPEWESRTEALLLGRTTYDIWKHAWGVWPEDAPGMMGEFTRRYNRVPKYVVAHSDPGLTWQNSHLVGPDFGSAIREIRQAHDGEIRVWGSSQVIRALAAYDLIDEIRTITYPLVLGTGKRLFGDGFPTTRFELAEARGLASGLIVSTYRRASAADRG